MSPSGSPYPIPVPAEPNPLPLALAFLAALLLVSAVLWWQVRRAWRQRAEDALEGPWPSNGHKPDEPR